jgi:hypothetical protein
MVHVNEYQRDAYCSLIRLSIQRDSFSRSFLPSGLFLLMIWLDVFKLVDRRWWIYPLGQT